MRKHSPFRLAGLALTWIALACSNTDTLLEATDPDLIDPADTRSPEGALAVYNGTLNRLRQITAGYTGEGSVWLFGGLLADEWATSSTFIQNDETDQRRIQINNSTVTNMYRELARTRTSANQSIALIREFRYPLALGVADTLRIAEMYFARGWAEMQLASDFCNGVVLSDGQAGEDIIYGTQLTVDSVFKVAIISFDSALAISNDTGTTAVRLNRASRIGKARAMLGIGGSTNIIAAGLLVANIPTASTGANSFAYNVTFATTSGDNVLWGQPLSSRRYSIGDSIEGNSRNILVTNNIPFFSLKDKRLPATFTIAVNKQDTTKRDTTRSQDGLTYSRTTTLYGRSTTTAIANGIDARMIEAEGLLVQNTVPTDNQWLAILNALRATPPALATFTPTAITPALTMPGTLQARVALHFREKAFWTFSRGQRLGDLRRLIRDYGYAPDGSTTFPTGAHFRGVTYGPDMNLPVPQAEQNNPNVGISKSTCIDRKA